MATLKANGRVLLEIPYFSKTERLMENGKILVRYDYSGSWKVAGKLKAGKIPTEVAEKWLTRTYAYRIQDGAKLIAKFRRIIPARYRTSFMMAEQVLGDDIDGLWSEMNDLCPQITFEDCREAKRLIEQFKLRATEWQATRTAS